MYTHTHTCTYMYTHVHIAAARTIAKGMYRLRVRVCTHIEHVLQMWLDFFLLYTNYLIIHTNKQLLCVYVLCVMYIRIICGHFHVMMMNCSAVVVWMDVKAGNNRPSSFHIHVSLWFCSCPSSSILVWEGWFPFACLSVFEGPISVLALAFLCLLSLKTAAAWTDPPC